MKPIDQLALVAAHDFTCSACEGTAGLVQLYNGGSGYQIRRISFTGELNGVINEGEAAIISKALSNADPALLHSQDWEIASFYCPECNACFCGKHWRCVDVFDEDFHDLIWGCCPNGHQRMIED